MSSSTTSGATYSTSSGTSLSTTSESTTSLSTTSGATYSTSSGTSLSTAHIYTTSSSSDSSSSESDTSESSSTSSETYSKSSSSTSSLSSNDTTSASSSSSGDEDMNYGGGVIPFLTSDATIAINTTTNVTADHIKYGDKTKAINVRNYKQAMLYLYCKGNNASCSKAVVFKFQISPGAQIWSDLADISVTLDGTSLVTSSTTNDLLDLSCVDYIRLQRCSNAETDSGYTADINAVLRFG